MEKQFILDLIDKKDFGALKAYFKEMNPADVASVLETLGERELLIAFRVLSKEEAAETFSYSSVAMKQMLIDGFSDKELKAVLEEMFVDDTVDIIEEMPANVVKRILKKYRRTNEKNY